MSKSVKNILIKEKNVFLDDFWHWHYYDNESENKRSNQNSLPTGEDEHVCYYIFRSEDPMNIYLLDKFKSTLLIYWF